MNQQAQLARTPQQVFVIPARNQVSSVGPTSSRQSASNTVTVQLLSNAPPTITPTSTAPLNKASIDHEVSHFKTPTVELETNCIFTMGFIWNFNNFF